MNKKYHCLCSVDKWIAQRCYILMGLLHRGYEKYSLHHFLYPTKYIHTKSDHVTNEKHPDIYPDLPNCRLACSKEDNVQEMLRHQFKMFSFSSSSPPPHLLMKLNHSKRVESFSNLLQLFECSFWTSPTFL